MLIEQADVRQLTASLTDDASLWSADSLSSASDSVVHDTDRTTRLLAAWAQVTAAGTTNSVPLFADSPEAQESWAKLGTLLAEAADRGEVGALEKRARQCAEDLQPSDRAKLIERTAKGASPLIRLAGGLDELLEAAALHRRCANEVEAGWVAAATWVVCALTEHNQSTSVTELVFDRIAHLLEAGHGADLWRTWPRVAASMMSSAFLSEFEPVPQDLPGYPVGLPLRAVEAAQAREDRQDVGTLEEFLTQPPDNQVLLAFELAMLIASCRTLPSRRAARRAARGETGTDDDALRSAVSDIMDELPADVVERTGRMYALSRRAVLAYIDGDPQTLGAVIDRIATWDDDPGRRTYPMPRFQFANQQALALGNDFLRLGETYGIHVTNREVADGAAPLIDRYAPAEYREAAHALVAALKAAGKGGVDFDPVTSDGPAGLVAFAATAASLVRNPRLFKAREPVRLSLIREIRESEAKALRIPDREMITDISDEEAFAFLYQHYGSDYPLPRDPEERAVWELDIVAVIKQHLLETPADATTQEQRIALDERIRGILRAAAGTPQRTPPPDRSGVVRTQPKRASKRKRKGR